MANKSDYINFVVSELWEPADERLNQFSSIRGGPWIILSFTAIYYLISTRVGPQFMAARKPFKLTYLLAAYNLMMVLINLTLHVRTSLITRFGYYSWGCAPFGPYSPSDDHVVFECFLLGELRDFVREVMQKAIEVGYWHVNVDLQHRLTK